mgnify:CR=1 FL=1
MTAASLLGRSCCEGLERGLGQAIEQTHRASVARRVIQSGVDRIAGVAVAAEGGEEERPQRVQIGGARAGELIECRECLFGVGAFLRLVCCFVGGCCWCC